MTGKTPEERFLDHKRGHHSGRGWIRDYGIGLLPELYVGLNRMSWEAASGMERKLAEQLRDSGLRVHQA
jgi:hypothetical protein